MYVWYKKVVGILLINTINLEYNLKMNLFNNLAISKGSGILDFILVIAFFGVIVTILIGIKRAIKKQANVKRMFLYSLGFFILMIGSTFFIDDPKSQSTKEDLAAEKAEAKKEAEAKEKAEAKKEAEAKKAVEAKKAAEASSLDNKVKKAIHKAFGKENSFDKKDSILGINYNKETGFILVKVYGSDNLTTNMIRKGMWMDVRDTLELLKDEDDLKMIDFNIVFPMQDQYGQESNDIIMKLSFSKETIDKINFDNLLTDNIPTIADSYWQHPALNKK
ncbi:hypothetical protein [Bacillus sp. 1P06AnD]|uniref:hypothetical protein n=1 Tax=Bacillus sp. 1P06AnD TaxID=3132208 RepID=UPI00399FC4E2